MKRGGSHGGEWLRFPLGVLAKAKGQGEQEPAWSGWDTLASSESPRNAQEETLAKRLF